MKNGLILKNILCLAAVLIISMGCGKTKTAELPTDSIPEPPAVTAEPTEPPVPAPEPTEQPVVTPEPTEPPVVTPEPTEAPPEDPSLWTLTQHSDSSGLECMFYTLCNETNGYLIVIDGGNPENEEHVRNVIRENGGVVNAWLVNHFHRDHASVFNAVYADPGDIAIEKVYTTNLDRDTFYSVAREWDTPETFEAFESVTEYAENMERLHSGDEFYLDDLKVEVFNAGDEDRKALYGNDIPNNCSLVLKISGQKDSLLILGDAHTDTLGSYLIDTYGDRIRAEYVQTGHHGTNSFPTTFYDAIGASYAFLDSPSWIFTEEKYTAAGLADYFHEKGAETFDLRTAPNAFIFE